jgi:hypothetical protein
MRGEEKKDQRQAIEHKSANVLSEKENRKRVQVDDDHPK